MNDCFAGLRARAGDHQTATKASADRSVWARLALETGDRFGTSGTKPWGLIRLGLVTGDARVCIKDEAMLATAYKTSHHNCMDSLELTVDGVRYRLEAPDTDAARANTTFRSFRGANMTAGPTALPTVSCTARSGQCRSGGPC